LILNRLVNVFLYIRCYPMRRLNKENLKLLIDQPTTTFNLKHNEDLVA